MTNLKLIIFLIFTIDYCYGQIPNNNLEFRKYKIFYAQEKLDILSTNQRYKNLSNQIIKELAIDFNLEITNVQDSADIRIDVKCIESNNIYENSKIFFFFKRKFEEKPIEGFIYKIPIHSGQLDFQQENRTLYKPFRICLSLITANLNAEKDNNLINPKYWVKLEFKNKSKIDSITFRKLSQITERILYFHQKEFDFQVVETLALNRNNNISIDISLESAKELSNEYNLFIIYKCNDIIFNGLIEKMSTTMIEGNDNFQILSLINREIKSLMLKFY